MERVGSSPGHPVIYIFFSLLLGCTPALHSDDLPVDINFNQYTRYGKFITERELDIWAAARNLAVVPDCPLKELQDHEAELIPSYGMNFNLFAPGRGRTFLYLDLVTFLPRAKYDPYRVSDYCDIIPEEESIVYSDTVSRSLIPDVRWIEIIVNGRVLKRLYSGAGSFIRSPVKITVEREDAFRRNLQITLLPSPGDLFFGVWDITVSPFPLEEE